MNVPLELSFHHIENTDALDAVVRDKAERLERVIPDLVSCRVAVEIPRSDSAEERGKDRFRVRVEATIPGRDTIATKDQNDVGPRNDVYQGIRRAFEAVERQLKGQVEQRRDHQPSTDGMALGVVKQLFERGNYGFLRSADGREVYFHEAALVGLELGDLTLGQRVHFTETLTERGPKATRVRHARHTAASAGAPPEATT